jgi:hypothetical protein
VLTTSVNAQQALEREEKIRCNDDIRNRTVATFIHSCWWWLLAWKNSKKRLRNFPFNLLVMIVSSWREKEWYDPSKVKFGYWRKKCFYLVLRQQSYFSIRSLIGLKFCVGSLDMLSYIRFKILSESEFEKASQYGSTEVVWILLFTSFWLVDFLFG